MIVFLLGLIRRNTPKIDMKHCSKIKVMQLTLFCFQMKTCFFGNIQWSRIFFLFCLNMGISFLLHESRVLELCNWIVASMWFRIYNVRFLKIPEFFIYNFKLSQQCTENFINLFSVNCSFCYRLLDIVFTLINENFWSSKTLTLQFAVFCSEYINVPSEWYW